MSRPVDDLAARLRRGKPDRWDTATVLEVIDAGHVRVDLGDSQRTAVVPSGVAVTPGQSVEVTVAGRVTTVRRPLDGTGWVTGGFTASSGWSVAAAAYRTVGGVRWINVEMTRTGSTLTGSSSGHLADTDVVTIPAAALPVTALPVTEISGSWRAQTTFGGMRINTSGVMQLTDLHPNGAVETGHYLRALIGFPV